MKVNSRLRFRMAQGFMYLALKINQKLRNLGALLWRFAILTSAKLLGATSKNLSMKLSQRDSLTTLDVYGLLELPVRSQLDTSMTVLSQSVGVTTTGQCSTTPGSQSNQDSLGILPA